ncbi:MAG: permease [Bacillota bacterium]
MAIIKRFRALIILSIILLGLTLISPERGTQALSLTGDSLIDMFSLLPPILVLVGLIDQWVDKQVLIKFMGDDSKFLGVIVALLLGGLAAGPMYIAFPIAITLLKKGANIRYVVFFLGVWTTAKLPIVLFEVAAFGWKYTLIHVSVGLIFFYLVGVFFEKRFDPDTLLKEDITSND